MTANINSEETKSTSSAPYTTVAVLKKLEDILGANLKWQATDNPYSINFFDNFTKLSQNLTELEKYLSSIAQKGGVDKINQFLKDKGFTIQLSDPKDPSAVAAASVFDLKVEWKEEGINYPVFLANNLGSVPGVWIKEVKGFFKSKHHDQLIVELETKTGEKFFLTKYEHPLDNKNPFAANEAAEKISLDKKSTSASDYPDGVQFPMADYQASGEMTWLQGAKTTTAEKENYHISQALYAHRFRLNEKGARAEAANAVIALKGAPAPLIIDGSYLAWFEIPSKSDKSLIPFAILVTKDSMSEPAEL